MKNPVKFLGFALAGFDQIVPIISIVIWILGKVLEGWKQFKDSDPPESE